jgi:hypothetical protein
MDSKRELMKRLNQLIITYNGAKDATIVDLDINDIPINPPLQNNTSHKIEDQSLKVSNNDEEIKFSSQVIEMNSVASPQKQVNGKCIYI